MPDITAIDEFLCASLRHLRAGEPASWPNGQEWADPGAGEEVWSRLDYHGVAMLFHGPGEALRTWPDALVARVGEEARLMALWEATHRSALSKLVDRLGEAGIESVFLKGTAIAYSLYSDPAARRRGDSDLLIRQADLDRARAILAQEGWYRNEDPHGLTHQEGWLFNSAGAFIHALDLHWASSDRPALQRVMPSEDVFATRRPLPRLGAYAQRCATPLIIIHEALNQKWHEMRGYYQGNEKVTGGRRLVWSVDFDLLATELEPADWDSLVATCDQRGVGPLVAEALRKAADDLGTTLPQAALAALAAQREDPAIAAYSRADNDTEEFWLNLLHAPSWRARGALLIHRGFPPESHLRAKYSHLAGWNYRLLQVRHLFDSAGRALRRLVAR